MRQHFIGQRLKLGLIVPWRVLEALFTLPLLVDCALNIGRPCHQRVGHWVLLLLGVAVQTISSSTSTSAALPPCEKLASTACEHRCCITTRRDRSAPLEHH